MPGIHLSLQRALHLTSSSFSPAKHPLKSPSVEDEEQRGSVLVQVPVPLDAVSSILTNSSRNYGSLAPNAQREELLPTPPTQNNLPVFENKRQKSVPAGVTSSMLSCLEPVTSQHSHNARGKQMALINLHGKYALMCTLRSLCCGRRLYLEPQSPKPSPESRNRGPEPLLWLPTKALSPRGSVCQSSGAATAFLLSPHSCQSLAPGTKAQTIPPKVTRGSTTAGSINTAIWPGVNRLHGTFPETWRGRNPGID